jgi:putative flavoprotein involved in K+ transport
MTLDLVVVGAGPAGLCAAWEAQKRDWNTVILERSEEVGGVWSWAPGNMRTLSPRHRDLMPDGSHPQGTGDYATASEVLALLNDFSEKLTVNWHLGLQALALEVGQDGTLHVTTESGTLVTRRLIVATGQHDEPVTPPIRGLHSRPHYHSRSFDVSTVAPGERVVVIGAGASATDLVERLLARQVNVTVSSRSPFRVHNPPPIRGVRASLSWAASGIPIALLPPNLRCTEPTLALGSFLRTAQERGDIAAVGATVELSETGVIVESQGLIHADHVVFATGYRSNMEWLGRPALCERGAPEQRRGISTTVSGLGFLGLSCMRTRRSGFLRGLAQDAAGVVGSLA